MVFFMTNNFWDFSLATYKRPKVKEACLSLQNSLHIDINILLFCCWSGAFDAQYMNKIIEDIGPFQSRIVTAIRSARKAVSPICNNVGASNQMQTTLRRKLLNVELEAEKFEQELLQDSARELKLGSPSPQTAANNIQLYLDTIDQQLNKELIDVLIIIISAAFPKSERKVFWNTSN